LHKQRKLKGSPVLSICYFAVLSKKLNAGAKLGTISSLGQSGWQSPVTAAKATLRMRNDTDRNKTALQRLESFRSAPGSSLSF